MIRCYTQNLVVLDKEENYFQNERGENFQYFRLTVKDVDPEKYHFDAVSCTKEVFDAVEKMGTYSFVADFSRYNNNSRFRFVEVNY